MKSYKCHKVVLATAITAIARNIEGQLDHYTCDDGKNYPIPQNVLKAEQEVIEGDYLVEYEGGYRSVSPKKAFEDGYMLEEEFMEEVTQSTLTIGSFGWAVEMMQRPAGVLKGHKVARTGWNGKGMFLMLIHPTANDQYSVIEKDGIVGTLAPYIAMKTADNQLVPWLASQTDILAGDWEIVE